MDRRGLAGIVREVVLARLHDSTNRTDIDHGARPPIRLLRRLGQQRQEGQRHEVNLRHVRPVRVRPGVEGFGRVVEEVGFHFVGGGGLGLLGVECDADVVDEDVEAFLFRGNLVVEAGDFGFGADICGDGDDGARDVLAVGLGYSVEFLGGAAADVDFGAVGGESLGCHEPDARAAAGDEGDLAMDAEEGGEFELVVVVVLRRHCGGGSELSLDCAEA